MRLFIGVKTGCEDYLSSLLQKLRKFGQGSFTSRENLHMTIRFLGEVPPAKIKDIREAITEAQRGTFSLTCQGLQIIGRDIVTAKVGGEKDKLSSLYDSLETALEKRGFQREARRYQPHITLARQFRPSAGFDVTSIPPVPALFMVTEIILFESKRKEGRLVYQCLFREPLN